MTRQSYWVLGGLGVCALALTIIGVMPSVRRSVARNRFVRQCIQGWLPVSLEVYPVTYKTVEAMATPWPDGWVEHTPRPGIRYMWGCAGSRQHCSLPQWRRTHSPTMAQ